MPFPLFLTLLYLTLRPQLAPDFAGDAVGLDDVLACKFRVALRHLDVGVSEGICKLLEIATVRPVPGCKGVPQAGIRRPIKVRKAV